MAENVLVDIERKWQRIWEEKVRWEAERDETREKFFLIFAYPGISGYLHVGHMRGFTYADVICRYKRQRGYSVLFPVGFHASGLPAISLAKRIQRGDPSTIEYLKRNGCPEEEIEKLKDVSYLIDFFSKVYINDYWKRFGFTIDLSRAMSTVSPGYKRFITWQFLKLNQKGLLTKKPHYAPYCPNCGPVAVDPSQTDVSEGGDADVLEYSLLLFEGPQQLILPAATLRPETLFGVTNMWLNPDVEYVVAEVDGRGWLLSREGYVKLSYQMGDVEEVGKIKGSELIGKSCRVPYTNREVPILPGPFVDPKVATGVVMSVPAHAPYDWIALEDLKGELREGEDPWGLKSVVEGIMPITIIKSRKYPMEDPAGHLVKRMGVKDQFEVEKLEEATREIYREEFHSGVLNDLCMDYAGLKVSEIKDTLKVDLENIGLIRPFYDFSKEVICRCGERVVIKRIENQWFIRYSDEELTERSVEHTERMMIYPEEYRRELPGVLEWFSDRACIRQGSWLGTEFPFAKGWIIEPISDSTLYPAYYIVSKYVNSGELKVEWMDERFFDYVYLGRGEISDFPEERRGVIEKIRRDFLYWYPLDINLGGKEHKTVHFPVFLMNHVAIMPKWAWPRGIFVHWWVTQKGGEKIAKSKGGAEPIPEAIAHYGVDSMRLYYCHVGSPEMDVEWREEVVSDYQSRLLKILNLVREIISGGGEGGEMDDYLRAALAKRFSEYLDAMENYALREAAGTVYYQTYQDLRWYLRRGGGGGEAFKEAVRTWAKMMMPFTPHLAEELWEMAGGEGLVSLSRTGEVEAYDQGVLAREEYLKGLLEDISHIRRATGREGERIVLYTAPGWKWEALERLMRMREEKGRVDPGRVIKEFLEKEELKDKKKVVPQIISRLAKDVMRMKEEDRQRYLSFRDEKDFLRRSIPFLSRELGAEVSVYEEDDPSKYDPRGRAHLALPLKPAVYVE